MRRKNVSHFQPRCHPHSFAGPRGLKPAALRLVLVGCFAFGLVAHARAADSLIPIAPSKVKVGGEIGRRIDVTIRNNLLRLDADQAFVQPFRDKKHDGGFIGLGMLIDSLVRFAAYSGDEQVLALKDRVVADTLKTQQPDGYIGMMVPASRMWKLWDIHEMSYIIYGLTSDYRYFGNKASLDGARQAADYITSRWLADPKRKPGGGDITVHMAVTGLAPALLALYEQTGDERYVEFCVRFRKIKGWNYPIVLGRWGPIGGHAYAYMDRCAAQLQLYRHQRDPVLRRQTDNTIDFLTKGDGLVITGAVGDHECWHNTQTGTINLGETCASASLIRLVDELLRLEGDSRYGDIMERDIYNTLFAAQSPDGRKIRYYCPFDGPRSYFQGDTYCCPNNYRRIVADLPTVIYYRFGTGIAINLYTASKADVPLAGGATLSIRQETDYPSSGRVVIHLDPSTKTRFPLRLRIPSWCGGAAVAVNGKPIGKNIKGGSFYALDRQWQAGDKVELQMPMVWRLIKGRKAQAGKIAIMRGPVVFCLNPDRQKKLADTDLRLITIDPATLTGPVEDDTVRPGGLACRVRAWGPGSWYPMAKANLSLVLSEFADPNGRATYFNVPNPDAKEFVHDELIQVGGRQ